MGLKIFFNLVSKFHPFFLLILSLYDSIFAGYDKFLDNDNIMFGFCSNFSTFCYSFEKNWKKLKKSLFRSVSKTDGIAAEPTV